MLEENLNRIKFLLNPEFLLKIILFVSVLIALISLYEVIKMWRKNGDEKYAKQVDENNTKIIIDQQELENNKVNLKLIGDVSTNIGDYNDTVYQLKNDEHVNLVMDGEEEVPVYSYTTLYEDFANF